MRSQRYLQDLPLSISLDHEMAEGRQKDREGVHGRKRSAAQAMHGGEECDMNDAKGEGERREAFGLSFKSAEDLLPQNLLAPGVGVQRRV